MVETDLMSSHSSNWKEIFRTHSIAQTIQLEKFVSQQIEEKGRELQQNVCFNYQSFIEASENLSNIRNNLEKVLQNSYEFQSMVSLPKVDRVSKFLSDNESISQTSGDYFIFLQRFYAHAILFVMELFNKEQYLQSSKLLIFCLRILPADLPNDHQCHILVNKLESCKNYLNNRLKQAMTSSLSKVSVVTSWILLNQANISSGLDIFLQECEDQLLILNDAREFSLTFLNTLKLARDFPNEIRIYLEASKNFNIFKEKEILRNICLDECYLKAYFSAEDVKVTTPFETLQQFDGDNILQQWKLSFFSKISHSEKSFFSNATSLTTLYQILEGLLSELSEPQFKEFYELWNSILQNHFIISSRNIIDSLGLYVNKIKEKLQICFEIPPTNSFDPWSFQLKQQVLNELKQNILPACGMDDGFQRFWQSLASFDMVLDESLQVLKKLQTLHLSFTLGDIIPNYLTLEDYLLNFVKTSFAQIYELVCSFVNNVAVMESSSEKQLRTSRCLKIVRLLKQFRHMDESVPFEDLIYKLQNILVRELTDFTTGIYINESKTNLDVAACITGNFFGPSFALYNSLIMLIDKLEVLGFDIVSDKFKGLLTPNLFESLFILNLERLKAAKSMDHMKQNTFDMEFINYLSDFTNNPREVIDYQHFIELIDLHVQDEFSKEDFDTVRANVKECVPKLLSFFTVLLPRVKAQKVIT